MLDNINNLLNENNLPKLSTKEFNELCSIAFGGNSKIVNKKVKRTKNTFKVKK